MSSMETFNLHLNGDDNPSARVKDAGDHEVTKLTLGNLTINLFTREDRGSHATDLANALIKAGEQLRSIYRAREVAEYDRIRTEEEWEWAARMTALERVREESVA